MFRQRIVSILAAQGLLIAAGCSTAPTDQANCNVPNWQEKGLADAKSGVQPEIIKKYQKSCPDQFSGDRLNAYKLGFFQGLQEFCTYDKGFELGSKNDIEKYSCPMELAEKFRQGQKDGYINYLEETGQHNTLHRIVTDFDDLERGTDFDRNVRAADEHEAHSFDDPSIPGG